MLKGQDIIKHITELKSRRDNYNTLYDDVNYWFQPSASDFVGDSANTEGQINNDHIYNDKGANSAERLAQVLYSTVMPVHEQFFTLVPSIETNEDMKLWWHGATEILSNALGTSNLSNIAIQALRSIVYYGSTATYPKFNKGKLSYQCYYPSDVWIDVDYDGDVSTLVTSKMTTACNLYKKYGKQCSDNVCEKGKKVGGKENIKIYNYFYLDNEFWKLAIVEEKTKHIITTYNFSSNPIQVPRTMANQYEIYGRSPAIRVLPTVKTLNKIEKTVLRASQKHVDPPIVIPFDASANASQMVYDTEAGGIIEVNVDSTGNTLIPQPIALGGNIEVGQYQIDKLERQIDEVFYLDALTLIMDMSAQATATQIESANAEKLDLIVPIIVQLLDGFVKPLVERSFQLLLDNGVIPPPPESYLRELEDQGLELDLDYNVEVQSSLIIKMRTLKLASSLQTVQTIGQLAQIKPDALDIIDIDKLVRAIAINSSLPTDAILSVDKLTELRNARAEQAEQAKREMMMSQMIKPMDAQKAPEQGSIGQVMQDTVGGAFEE